MPLPVLAAILGAGLLAQGGNQLFKNRKQRRQGERLQGILGDLPQGAGQDQQVRALAEGGLLSPSQFAQYGFGDQGSNRDFLESLSEIGYQGDVTGRNQAARDATVQSGADYRAEQARNDAANAAETKIFEQQSAIELAAQQEAQKVQQRMQDRERAVWLSTQIEGSRMLPGSLTDAQTRAFEFELSEIDEQDFFSYKNSVYGEAEPNTDAMARLRSAYPTFTSSPYVGGQWGALRDNYQRRNAEDQAIVDQIIQDAQNRILRVADPTATTTNTLPPPRTLTGGGVPNSAVTPD